MTLIPDLQRDLVNAAGRMTRPRLTPAARAAATGAAAVLLLATALVLVTNGEGERSRGPAEPAADAPPEPPPAGHPTDTPTPPPRRFRYEPVPGSVSAPVEFEFAGVSYSAKGFRSDGGVICTTEERVAGPLAPRLEGGSCLSERILRDALADGPVHMYAGGGVAPTMAAGYARADVAKLSLVDPAEGDMVVLSEPWEPEPWEGDPIRFVYVISNVPPERHVPSFTGHRFEAELTNGDVVPAP